MKRIEYLPEFIEHLRACGRPYKDNPQADGRAGVLTTCLLHNDRSPSMSVFEPENEKDELVFHCFACASKTPPPTQGDYRAAEKAKGARIAKPRKREVARYEYRDKHGELILTKIRYKPKDFRADWSVDRSRQVPWYYENFLVQALQKTPDRPVFWCEGEKDVTLAATCLTVIATTSFSNTKHGDLNILRDANVVIVPDMDQVGRDAAKQKAALLRGVAKTVKILELPGLDGSKGKKDLADWIHEARSRTQDSQGWVREFNQLVQNCPILDAPSEAGASTGSAGSGNSGSSSPSLPAKSSANVNWLNELDATAPNKQGNIGVFPVVGNYRKILATHPALADKIRLNKLRQQIEVWGDLPWDRSHVSDNGWRGTDTTRFIEWVGTQCAWTGKIAKSDVEDVVDVVALNNAYDPVADYLDQLPTLADPDAVLDRFLGYLATSDDLGYARFVAKKWLTGVVQRGYALKHPDPGIRGVKMDAVLILVGDQGSGKSSTFKILGSAVPGAFEDGHVDIEGKDTLLKTASTWIWEIQEWYAAKKADRDKFKSFISNTCEKVRPPYERRSIEFPRRTAFCGTLNPTNMGFLNDETGNRRLWPLNVGSWLDLDGVRKDRDEIWAAAVTWWRAGERWLPTKAEMDMLAQAQGQHETLPDLYDELVDFLLFDHMGRERKGPVVTKFHTSEFAERVWPDTELKRGRSRENFLMDKVTTYFKWKKCRAVRSDISKNIVSTGYVAPLDWSNAVANQLRPERGLGVVAASDAPSNSGAGGSEGSGPPEGRDLDVNGANMLPDIANNQGIEKPSQTTSVASVANNTNNDYNSNTIGDSKGLPRGFIESATIDYMTTDPETPSPASTSSSGSSGEGQVPASSDAEIPDPPEDLLAKLPGRTRFSERTLRQLRDYYARNGEWPKL